MDQDYWSIDDIFADSQKLPCTFRLDVPGLGYLEGHDDPDIKEHTRIELPFWLAETLALHDFVDLHIPKPFTSRVRNALDAHARSVRLRNLCPWFFGFGARLGGLLEDGGLLLETLQKALQSRLPEIMDQTQHVGVSTAGSIAGRDIGLGGFGGGGDEGGAGHMTIEGAEFVADLDEGEKELFALGHASAKAVRDYMAGG